MNVWLACGYMNYFIEVVQFQLKRKNITRWSVSIITPFFNVHITTPLYDCRVIYKASKISIMKRVRYFYVWKIKEKIILCIEYDYEIVVMYVLFGFSYGLSWLIRQNVYSVHIIFWFLCVVCVHNTWHRHLCLPLYTPISYVYKQCT